MDLPISLIVVVETRRLDRVSIADVKEEQLPLRLDWRHAFHLENVLTVALISPWRYGTDTFGSVIPLAALAAISSNIG
jgi:hypothetical protein